MNFRKKTGISDPNFSLPGAKIVVLGSIGSGKSTLVKDFVDEFDASGRRVMVIDYDKIAHWVLENNQRIKFQVFELFGTVTRSEIAQQMFQDPSLIAKQQALILPAVYSEAFKQSARALAEGYSVIHEIPVLAETRKYWPSELQGYFDTAYILHISEDEAVARLSGEGGAGERRSRSMDADDVRRRYRAQTNLEGRIAAAYEIAQEVVVL